MVRYQPCAEFLSPGQIGAVITAIRSDRMFEIGGLSHVYSLERPDQPIGYVGDEHLDLCYPDDPEESDGLDHLRGELLVVYFSALDEFGMENYLFSAPADLTEE